MLGFLLAAAIASPIAAPAQAADPCRFRQRPSASEQPLVTAYDLATLTDIGRSDPHDTATSLGVSVDGKHVAFVERRANPDTNSFCQRLMLVDTKGGPARELDRGGSFIRATLSLFGLAALRGGFAAVVPPRWSPDDRLIAYLRRENDVTQIWTVDLASGMARQATTSSSDIEDFAWSADGTGFVVARRPGLVATRAAIEAEGREGWLFDKRFSPMQQHRPFPLELVPTVYDWVDRTTGKERAASADEIARLKQEARPGRPAGARRFDQNGRGDRVWVEKAQPDRLIADDRLVLSAASGQRTDFLLPPATRILGLWWDASGKAVYVQTRGGWGGGEAGLFRWAVGMRAPKAVLRTWDALIGCVPAGDALLCGRESANVPRRIVRIDMRSGAQSILYDPNKAFAALDLGAARRFTFRNGYGLPCYAYLVLPPTHRAGQKHPLVVVQYDSDGFLRGGTGDEVPIQVLAAQGFAVLDFNRPPLLPTELQATSEPEMRSRGHVDWIDQRNVESALELAVAQAVGTGTVDSSRMGITGLSAGTSNAQWALINSRLFTVAALGNCCEDKIALPLNGGPGYEYYRREMGYPSFDEDAPDFWKPLSLLQNVDRITAPILVQTVDAEYAMGLEVFSAFKQRHKPIEVRVFPDEVHIKWHPAHRLSLYERYVAWFRFWLMGRMDCSPDRHEEMARWAAMLSPDARAALFCDAPSAALPGSRPGLGV